MKVKGTRYAQLNSVGRQLAQGEPSELLLTGQLRSFTGKSSLAPFFKESLNVYESLISDWPSKSILIDAFVLRCNAAKPDSKRAFEAVVSNLRNGLLAFVRCRNYSVLPMKDWPIELAHEFVNWLRTDCSHRNSDNGTRPRHENTARKYYGELVLIFNQIRLHEPLRSRCPDFEEIVGNPFEDAHRNTKKTRVLGRDVLTSILVAARRECLATIEKFSHAKELFNSNIVPALNVNRKMAKYKNLDAVLWELRKSYPKRLPPFQAIKASNIDLFNAINKYHGGARTVWPHFQPDGRSITPFVVLLTIYCQANTDPLRALRLSDLSEVTVLQGDRLVTRLSQDIDKGRSRTYARSFAKDMLDEASPSKLFEFLREWTSWIRQHANEYSEHVFIFCSHENLIRGFNTAVDIGRSGDTIWHHQLKEFCTRNGLGIFNLRELRNSALDVAKILLHDDLRAIKALSGTTTESVLREHYTGDGALLRRNLTVAKLQSVQERYIATKGRVNHGHAPEEQDLFAATPGWGCVDPYDSPIPGEVPGRICRALGRCPACALGTLKLDSAYSFARCLQLSEELNRAKIYLPIGRWNDVFAEVERILNEEWLPMFKTSPLIDEVRLMSLPPIGIIE